MRLSDSSLLFVHFEVSFIIIIIMSNKHIITLIEFILFAHVIKLTGMFLQVVCN